MDHEHSLLDGSLDGSLLELVGEEVNMVLNNIDKVSFDKIYKAESVIKLEIAGHHILSGLLELFIPAILKEHKTSNEKNLLRLIPKQYLQFHEKDNPYLRTLCILDFISGMTDNYAVDLYRRIKGISISLS
jgi:dGTPase